jgi:hypothetical protein
VSVGAAIVVELARVCGIDDCKKINESVVAFPFSVTFKIVIIECRKGNTFARMFSNELDKFWIAETYKLICDIRARYPI